MIAVLYAREDSIYKQLGCDVYDISRDARTYTGNSAVIAHPPCRAWGQLSHFAKPRPDEKELAFHAIDVIRKNGGVLEHPRASKLWPKYLPMPGKIDEYGGWTLLIHQIWFGHKAIKKTFLYIVGVKPSELPTYPVTFDTNVYRVGGNSKSKIKKKEVTKREREATPKNLAIWLIDLCNIINKKK